MSLRKDNELLCEFSATRSCAKDVCPWSHTCDLDDQLVRILCIEVTYKSSCNVIYVYKERYSSLEDRF